VVAADTIVVPAGGVCEALYLVEDGEVGAGALKFVRGDCFGELGLLRGLASTVATTATIDSRYWSLNKDAFASVIVSPLDERNEKRCTLLGRVDIFSTLTDDEVYSVAHSAKEELLDAAEEPVVLCKQGQPSSTLFVVSQGSVECWQNDAEGAETLVATLGEGGASEEQVLLMEKPANATLRVPDRASVLRIDRAVMVQLVGPLEAVLKRNMEVYGKYIME
jgi:cAMP-dependent protein kinase regulator